MNMNMIENDIFDFIDKFLSESIEVIEDNFDFIEQYQLIKPKENYFLVIKFLSTIMNHFTSLDYGFSSNTLNKIYRDVKNLKNIYEINQNYLTNVESIFENKFLKKVPLFLEMQEEALAIKKNIPIDDYDKESLVIIKKHHTIMKTIYFENFQNIFEEQIHEILDSLKNILNSKIYYFDTLLWIEANQSNTIKRLLNTIKKELQIDSRIYITHRLTIDLPYTEDYKYLQQCLRIYK